MIVTNDCFEQEAVGDKLQSINEVVNRCASVGNCQRIISGGTIKTLNLRRQNIEQY